jgi:signal transduction histidine kinase
MQIRLRLTLQFSLVVFFFLVMSFGLIYFFLFRYNQEQFHERLYAKAITSARLLLHIEQVDSSLLKIIDRAKSDVLYSENITIYDSANTEIYTNNDTIFFDLKPEALNAVRRSGTRYFSYKEFEVVGVRFRDRHAEFVVIAGAIDEAGDGLLVNLRALLIALLMISILMVLGTGWVFAGRALKPINALIADVESISEQDLDQRLREPRHNDELGRLIRIFNGLLARIDRAFALQRSFVSNVSHELKNPLTKITSQLEVTLLNARSNEEYRKTMESVLEDTRELNLLSTSLLDLASLHEENRTFSIMKVRVDEVLWEAMEKVRGLDPQYHTEVVKVELPDKEERVSIYGNPYLLRTALINIMENACKFSYDHAARISLFCDSSRIHVRVADHGPGIDEISLKDVFQPFFRGDQTSRTKGYGIGLSLSQRIVRIYDGEITISSRVGIGTEVLITLPAIDKF